MCNAQKRSDQNGNVDGAIVQSIQDADGEPDPPIRLRETKKSLETWRIFFLRQGNEGN